MIDLPLHLLPSKLREIAEYCGNDTAMLLLEHAGGGTILVIKPENLDSMHNLVIWLGVERAQKFCDAFAGEIIKVPRAAAALRTLRNQKIREERRAGATLFTLARRYGMTDRQISAILGNEETKADQFDLFGMP